MAYKCENCGKGKTHGHAVSHAKVRLGRVFKPNLHLIPVLKQGCKTTAKLCTKCIKRLKKDGRVGNYRVFKIKPKTEKREKISLTKIKAEKKSSKTEKTEKTPIDISSIIGSKK